MAKITGNRSLHFGTLDEAMAEAERLTMLSTTTVGTFSHAQNVDHLARTLRVVVGDVAAPKFPVFIKWIVRFRLNAILTQPLKPGIKLPSGAQPVFWSEEDLPLDEAMTSLHKGYGRFRQQRADGFPPHPLFGVLTDAQQEMLQCRHFELHQGMVIESSLLG